MLMHPPNSAKHAACAITAKNNSRQREEVSKRAVEGYAYAAQAHEHEGQEAVAQDGSGACERERGGEMAATFR